MSGYVQWNRGQQRGRGGTRTSKREQSQHMRRVQQQQALFRQAERIDALRLAETAAKPTTKEPEE